LGFSTNTRTADSTSYAVHIHVLWVVNPVNKNIEPVSEENYISMPLGYAIGPCDVVAKHMSKRHVIPTYAVLFGCDEHTVRMASLIRSFNIAAT
jgi:hypothetical protein